MTESDISLHAATFIGFSWTLSGRHKYFEEQVFCLILVLSVDRGTLQLGYTTDY